MIERVVLHQSRFRTPGLSPDPRGVALGPLGLVLLSSPDRLVAFLRATGEEGALDELLDSLRIIQVLSPLRTRETVVEVQAGSSHRMDRLAAIARLVGGMVFTGSGRHFVKYRDAQAPFGYDIGELLADPGDLALYHDRFAQPYRSDKVVPVRDLILRLAPVSQPRARTEAPRSLYALLRPGLSDSVVGYLARWNVSARVALVEWERGGTSNQLERAYLLHLAQPAVRFVNLLRSLPGVRLFVPDGERTAVEYGFRHPIPLSACTPLFSAEELVLFRAGGEGAIALPQRPPLVDVLTVTSLTATGEAAVQRANTQAVQASFALPLSLVSSGSPPRRVAASIVDKREQDKLGRLLSILPPSVVGKLSVAFTEHAIYLYGPDALGSIPLGTLYEDVGDNIFVPLGYTLSPPLPRDILRQVAHAEHGTRLFVTGAKPYPITSVLESSFESATRLLVDELPVFEDAAVAPPLDGDRPLPDLWPSPPGLLSGLTSPGAREPVPPPRDPSAAMYEAGAAPPGGDPDRG